MFLFPSKQKKEELSLIIEIQSGLVQGIITIFRIDQSPKVIFSIVKKIQRKEHTEGSHLIKAMLKAVAEVSEIISHEGALRIKENNLSIDQIRNIHYIFSSPWVISHSRTLKIKYEIDTEITEKLIKDIIDKDYNELIKASISENKESNKEYDLICIEQKIFELKLNGYYVSNYNNKKTKDLEISFASSLGSEHVLKKIHLVVSHYIYTRYRINHSSVLASFTALKTFGNYGDYISIHIHDESTDLLVSKNGMCSSIASFPYGTSTFLRKVQHTLKSNFAEGGSIVSLLYGGKLEEREENRLRKIIEPIMIGWYMELLEIIKNYNEPIHLPKTIYLYSHDYFDVFKQSLLKNDNGKFNFEIISYNELPLVELVTFDKSDRNSLTATHVLSLKSMI